MRLLPWTCILVLLTASAVAQKVYSLAPPYLKFESVFFTVAAQLDMEFALQGAAIHYTLNGASPTEQDPVYHQPLRISDSITVVTARSFAPLYLPSVPVRVNFYPAGLPIHHLTGPSPHPRHPGNHPLGLYDQKGGFCSSASANWQGFDQDLIQLECYLEKDQPIKQVLVHVLQQESSWIFLPSRIEVEALQSGKTTFQHCGQWKAEVQSSQSPTQCVPILIPLPDSVSTSCIRLRIHGVTSIPSWHPAQGQHAWVFIDEIKFY